MTSGPYELTNKDELGPWRPRSEELTGLANRPGRQWGLRSNQLQDEGVPWPDHERRAFLEVKDEMSEKGVRVMPELLEIVRSAEIVPRPAPA